MEKFRYRNSERISKSIDVVYGISDNTERLYGNGEVALHILPGQT
jgi:hypothetical protein